MHTGNGYCSLGGWLAWWVSAKAVVTVDVSCVEIIGILRWATPTPIQGVVRPAIVRVLPSDAIAIVVVVHAIVIVLRVVVVFCSGDRRAEDQRAEDAACDDSTGVAVIVAAAGVSIGDGAIAELSTATAIDPDAARVESPTVALFATGSGDLSHELHLVLRICAAVMVVAVVA